MINEISIKNFKSIKDLTLPCKKLNVFIGEPNSGKSNIIEALSMLSQNVMTRENFSQTVRFKDIGGLFHNSKYTQAIEISAGILDATLKYDIAENGINNNRFLFSVANSSITLSHDGNVMGNLMGISTPFRFYEYKRLSSFEHDYLPHLSPPFGENLPILLLGNDELKKWVSEFLRSKGLRLIIKPVANDIEFAKVGDDVEYNYPYIALSDTLKRIIFYTLAMDSNKDKILLFDEPDTYTFPDNTKLLGESIALDETNQFFITTHNPYLLLSMIEKSSLSDINIFITSLKDGETVVTPMTSEQISNELDRESLDVFFNLDNIVSE